MTGSTAANAPCPSEDALVDFVGGTADVQARAAIEDHIDGCARCAETLAMFGGAYATTGTSQDGPAPEPEPPPTEAFAGRYKIRECVGAGAGGTVYAAWDPELDRVVALKVLRGQAAGGSRGAHRIAREARVMAKVMHPNVVAVHDVGSTGDHVFIAAEFVEGCTMAAWRHAKPRSWAEIVEVFVAAGRGLAAIHACGLVHRDFKPHNVMVGDDGRVRVTDFGLARLRPELEQEHRDVTLAPMEDPIASPTMFAETLATQTRTGMLVGTPAYMSPEQWLGKIADARSDQFSFCVALYEALFEVRPFVGATSTLLAAAVIEGEARSPPATRVPRWVVRVVMRGLSREPAQRFADMDALLGELVEAPRRRRRRRLAAAVGAGFVAVAGGAFGLARLPTHAGCTEPDRLGALWDPVAQAEVRVVLGDEFDATATHVSAWVDAWRGAQRELCDSIDDPTHTTAAQAGLECLDRRLSSMHAALSVMRESGTAGAALAAMVESIPTPHECVDPSAWLTIQPEHHTPMGRVLAAAIAEDIDRIEALRYAARHDEALAVAIAVLARAEIDGDQAVRAMALLALGQLYSAHKDAEPAAATLRDAVWAAEASGHVVVAVDAWTELAAVEGGQLERYADGLADAERARAALYRVHDPMRELTLAADVAMLHSVAGKYDLALAGQLDVLERGIAVYGERHRQIARVHINIAAVLTHLGRLDEAIAHAEQGIAIQRELHPGPHPITAEMMSTLGVLHVQLGHYDAARDVLKEALAMLDASSDASRTTRATLVANLAGVELSRGDAKAAVVSYTEALALNREVHGPKHPDIALGLHNLASAQDKAGDPRLAIATYREALALRLVTSGPDHPGTANTLHNLGTILTKHGDVTEAIADLERAVLVREQTKVDPWRRASSHYMLAKAYEAAHRRTDAITQAEAARTLLREMAPRHAEMLTALDDWQAHLPNP